MSNLTGKTRYREYKGKLVLQVQEHYTTEDNMGGYDIDIQHHVRWRDATVEDISEGWPAENTD